jgi:CelD/BcsL family acetyltransferase involved in cellulose biosynthesis
MSAQQGWLRLGIAWISDVPAAVQLWFVKDRVAYIFKVAFDDTFKKESIGSVATYKMFEYVIQNDDVREIDYLTGADAYKRDWMTECGRLDGLVAFNSRTAKGLIAACRHVGGHYLKTRLRRAANRVVGPAGGHDEIQGAP